MRDSDNLLREITDARDTLTRSDRRVADVILADPDSASRMSIASLASLALVSEPTVNRFCRKFEPLGYREFKLRLAQSLVRDLPYVSSSVAKGDDTETVIDKILDSTIIAVQTLRDQLDAPLLEQVVDRMLSARRIFFFGLGVSSAVASDAEHHFFRFDLPVQAHGDVLMQRMLAAAAGPDELFFMISHTGRTKDLVDTAAIAAQRGAGLVALTARQSPLARCCPLAIELDESENTDAYMPMTSRMVHLAVLDILATRITLRCGDALQPHLRAIKESLMPTRYASGTPASNSALINELDSPTLEKENARAE